MTSSEAPSFAIFEDPQPQDQPQEALVNHPLQRLPQPAGNKRHKEKDLSLDDQAAIRKMKEWTGWGITDIARTVPFTTRQVQYAVEKPISRQKTNPRPGGHRLDEEEL